MKLNAIGEFGFIERLKPMFSHLVGEQQMGIGDDCAVIPSDDGFDWLVTTDLLMEGVHFLREAIPPQHLGIKSMAVNFSDIAAMGGVPVGSFLSIAIPADVEVEYLDELTKGMYAISEQYGVPLMGGDTSKSLKHLAINVCVLGKCPKGTARLRSMAQVNDVICTTGPLGDSAGGLQVLLNHIPIAGDAATLVDRHHLPIPRINEGRLLASFDGVHAMMDISDGIASDLPHILRASRCGAVVDLDKLPVSSVLERAALQHGWSAEELAASGGEDYELLCTIKPDAFESISHAFANAFGRPLMPIGVIREGTASICWNRNGQAASLQGGGFAHF